MLSTNHLDELQNQTRLEIQRVSEVHRERLQLCYHEFEQWCHGRRYPFAELIQEYFSAALCSRLGFHGLMRPQETFNLCVGDFAFPSPGRSEPLVLAIIDPKNRSFLGRRQFRVIHDEGTIRWAEWFCHDRPRHARVWPGSPQLFRRYWDWSLSEIGAAALGLTPASLRPGGATFLYRTGTAIASIKYRGAWASERAMSVYIQEAMSAFVLQALPLPVQQSLWFRAERDLPLLDTAPPCSWRSLFQREAPRPPSKRSTSQPPIANGSLSTWASASTRARRSSLSPRRTRQC